MARQSIGISIGGGKLTVDIETSGTGANTVCNGAYLINNDPNPLSVYRLSVYFVDQAQQPWVMQNPPGPGEYFFDAPFPIKLSDVWFWNGAQVNRE